MVGAWGSLTPPRSEVPRPTSDHLPIGIVLVAWTRLVVLVSAVKLKKVRVRLDRAMDPPAMKMKGCRILQSLLPIALLS